MLIDDCVDVELSLSLSNGKPRLAADILSLMLAELKQNHTDINNAFRESRFDDALELIHKLHGACCYCGVPQLKAICKRLEKQLSAQRCLPALDDILLFDEIVETLLVWHAAHDIHQVFLLDK